MKNIKNVLQIKRNAEVRFNEYPEVFPETLPTPIYELRQRGFSGMLKARDPFGRRVICMNADEWNPDEISMEQVTSGMTNFADRLLLDEDGMTNGIICIGNFHGIEWKHVKELTLPALLRILNIFWVRKC
ncbi:unnamed protein product [Orchesella dallaii]|uniref:CRAL-TRIO domain-containing protein n=1 Tax=Orchesella dallaii TaxID=48710 RepID=A0ABP1R4M9_9HEXA